MDHRLLTRVVLRNYKSIAACDVSPAQLSFFVGPNGAGKSNFLDALRFVADSLRLSLDHALRDRGGIREVRRRAGGRTHSLGIRIEFDLAEWAGHYAFAVGAERRGGYRIEQEECRVDQRDGCDSHFYEVEHGAVVDSNLSAPPAAAADRLYLVNVSGVDAFRPVYDALSGMGFYNLEPDAIRDLQTPGPGELLKRDGSNMASVLSGLAAHSPDFKRRIDSYLGAVVSGVDGVVRRKVGHKETIEFRQEARGWQHPWRFPASSMSDGTLRALGVLVALFQGAGSGTSSRRLLGIEEPEAGLHPAAAGVLVDALRDAAGHAQVLVTSHGTELLDNHEVPGGSIFAVVAEYAGEQSGVPETKIGSLDPAGRSALRDRLFTAGELLRMDQLRPAPSMPHPEPGRLRLFGRRH